MKIRDVYQRYTARHETVGPEAPIADVIASVARDRGSRDVFVVDESQALSGIIRMDEILRRLGSKHLPERGFMSASDILGTRAKDLMIEPLSVAPEDDVDDALRIAVRFDLEDLPVVQDGKVVGQIDCFEMLHALQSAG